MTFSEQLIRHRKRLGLSQEQLGEKIGVSRQTISKWELGDTTPEMEKLILLSRLFDVSIDDLVGNVSEDTPAANAYAVALPLHKWHYEYKSRRTLWGLPLVHVNLGIGHYTAKGIFAFGTVAKGVVAVGAAAAGLVAVGAAAVGLFAVGALALGLMAAVGSIAVGTVAIGALAIGILSIGGCALGVYAVGGAAFAAKIAAGGYASAPIAIGDSVNGQFMFDFDAGVPQEAVRQAIQTLYPKTWQVLVALFVGAVQ